jgi:hypothetical protein
VVVRVASTLLIGIALSARAAAADSTPVQVSLEAPAGCSSAREFYDAVRARTGRVHLSPGGGEALALRVVVIRNRGKFQGELRVSDPRGQSSTRKVSGATCEEVVRALSLTAALAVDQIVEPTQDSARSSNERTTNGTDGTNGTSATGADSGEAKSGATDGGAASTVDRNRAGAKPRTERDTGADAADGDDTDADGEASDDSSSNGSDDGRPLVAEVGAQALVGEIISPRLSVGGALFVDVMKPGSGWFSPSLGVAVAHVPAELGQTGGDVSIRWTAVMVTACPLRFQPSDTISIQPCAAGSGGWLTARGESSETPATASRSWWSAGVLGRISSAIGGGTAVRFELGLSVPLLRRRFITTPPEETVAESPAISALGALGVAHAF